jgi:geranyl diphosphate 2-C-methyltransferase
MKNGSYHLSIANFYDARVQNPADLNARLAGPQARPVHHHAGIVRINEPTPNGNVEAALSWLYHTEQGLCDFIWHTIQGLSQRYPSRLLDLGCGEGGTAARFSELACQSSLEVVGLTLSSKQRDMATDNCPRGRFLVADMLAEDTLAGEQFDVAYAIESTEYLGVDGLAQLMPRVFNWLAPRGLLVIVAGSRSPLLEPTDPAVRFFDEHYRTRLSSSDDYRRLGAAAGLKLTADIDLAPATLPYWRIRRDHPTLRNSHQAAIEKLLVRVLETGIGEYRLWAWYRGDSG